MRAGLFTYHFSDNYGALFQAYALRKWLLNRNVDAEFVNYHPEYVEEGGPLDRPWKPSLWRKNATILYMRQAHIRRKLFGDREQHARFDQFRAEHLGVRGPRLRDRDALGSVIGTYDMLVCGSDQIWNPSIQRGLDPVYFLDIPGAENARKVAYAPSFGRGAIEASHNTELAKHVSQLDGISVREATGLDILETAGIARSKACVVPDPTVLLGGFDDILGPREGSDSSVFCYALRTDEVIRDAAIAAGEVVGGPVKAPRTTHQRWSDIGEGVTPGPVEWLSMLARAEVVVSNSFHGVALSVVLNKPFIAVGLPGKRAKMNARVQNLLTIAGLLDRITTSAEPKHIRELVDKPIEWASVNARMAAVRSEAEAYLDQQIAAARA